MWSLALQTFLLILPPGLHNQTGSNPRTSVSIDSSRHELVITAGPFALPSMPPDTAPMMDHGSTHDTPVHRFVWPVEGWFRGFRIELLDARGNPLPRHLLHHLVILNFDRRQLVYSAAERLFGAGTETRDASVPRSIGVPMPANTNMGLYVAWHNDTGRALDGVTLRLVMQWTPRNQKPRPVDVMPLYMDVNLTVGEGNAFDLPPGRSSQSHDFTLPVGGRLLAVSGHLHDYGVIIRLEDAESGKVITRIEPVRDQKGLIMRMGHRLFGVRSDGLKLRAGRRYRVVAEYDNPTESTLINGGMAHMVGLFAPEDMAKWPAIEPDDPTYLKDLTSLLNRGEAEHHH